MPADYSPYIDLRIHDVQPVDVYLGAIELARRTIPEFNLRQGTPEDALFQAFAYMSSLSVGAINRLPSRLMEGIAEILGVSRFYGGRASVVVEIISMDNDGAYLPAGSIFSYSEIIGSDKYQYTFELAEDVIIDSVTSGTALPAVVTLYSQAVGLHPVMVAGESLVPINVNVNLDSVKVLEDGLSTTGTVGSITGSGPWVATITNMTSMSGFAVGSSLSATAGTGTLHGGSPTSVVVTSIVSSTSLTYTVTGGTTPTAGTVTNIISSSENPFINGISPETDLNYLSRTTTHLASLSDVLITANQLQSYIAASYSNISKCRVYDNTDYNTLASLEIGASLVPGYVTAFVYGIGQNLSLSERNSITSEIILKSMSGLIINIENFTRAKAAIEVTVVYDSKLEEFDIELLVKSIIANALSPENFPTNEEHLRTSYISAFLLGTDGIISVGEVVIDGIDGNSDTNETNGDLPFIYKGTLPLVSNGYSATGTVGSITGSGPWVATITNMTSTSDFAVGSSLSATAGTGTLKGGSPTSVLVTSILSSTSLTYTVTGGTTPTAGTVTNIDNDIRVTLISRAT